jgi:hypothetical protein
MDKAAFRFGPRRWTCRAFESCRICRVHPDRRATLTAHAFGDAEVVYVATVKEHFVDIRKGTTEPLQQPGELREVPRQPGADEEQLRTVLDEVEVDHVVAEAVHSGYGEGRQRASDVDTYSPRQFRGAGVDQAAEH